MSSLSDTSEYALIERAIRYLHHHSEGQPALSEAAAEVGLSEFHFQRLFKRWAGVSPKRFLQYVTAERARQLLTVPRSTLDVAMEVGLSGNGRLHDLTINVYAMTPGEISRRGDGLIVSYGFHPSPFGECLMGTTEHGICHLSFVSADGPGVGIDEMRTEWPHASLVEAPTETEVIARRIFDPATRTDVPITLLLRGTNFQIRVWEALLRIPVGHLTTYHRLAEAIDRPTAARAVGSAVARNTIGYLIPCHRVIRSTGLFGDYRWGVDRKRLMIGWEAARTDAL